eukprot:g36533.t1
MPTVRQKMVVVKQKRNEQLKHWLGSETEFEPPVLKKKKTKVKFNDDGIFLAACLSCDTSEVKELLDGGLDVNYANVDGLTALHQFLLLLILWGEFGCDDIGGDSINEEGGW